MTTNDIHNRTWEIPETHLIEFLRKLKLARNFKEAMMHTVIHRHRDGAITTQSHYIE